MKSCPDGYPSCRKAEATGVWCGASCDAMTDARMTTVDDDRVLHMLPGALVNVITVGEPLSATIIYPEPDDDAPDQPAT